MFMRVCWEVVLHCPVGLSSLGCLVRMFLSAGDLPVQSSYSLWVCQFLRPSMRLAGQGGLGRRWRLWLVGSWMPRAALMASVIRLMRVGGANGQMVSLTFALPLKVNSIGRCKLPQSLLSNTRVSHRS